MERLRFKHFHTRVGKREQMMREIVEPFHHDYWVATMYTHQLDFGLLIILGRNIATGNYRPSRENNWTRVGNDAWLHDMAI